MRRRRNPAEFDELHRRFSDALVRLGDEKTTRAASLVFVAGHQLAPVVLREKQVPPTEAKAFAATMREFGRSRVPKDLSGWFSKNRRALEHLVHSASWPDKGTSAEQTISVDGLDVHNQTGADVSANVKMLETVVTLLRDSGVPRIEEVIYGDVYLVGSIARKHSLKAFYDPARDKLFVLVVKRFETDFVNSTIHEFGHRYWNRFLSQPVKGQWTRWHFDVENDATRAFEYKMPSVGDLLKYAKGDKRIASIAERPGYGKILWLDDGSGIKLDSYWDVERKNAIMAAYPTLYASKNKEEHFCEALALFCMGDLHGVHAEAFTRIFDVAVAEPALPLPPPPLADPGPKGQITMFNPSRARTIARRITRL